MKKQDAHIPTDETALREQGLLAGMLAKLPQEEAPAGLLPGVMAGVMAGAGSRARKAPWSLRALRWLAEPKTFSFRPAVLAPAAMACVALIALALPGLRESSPTLVAEQAPAQVQAPAQALSQVQIPQQPEVVTASLGDRKTVVFTLDEPKDASVALVGSFNSWRPAANQMQYDEASGQWRVSVSLPSGAHAYGFLVNGELIPDPSASLYQDDGFGAMNSIVIVDTPHEQAI